MICIFFFFNRVLRCTRINTREISGKTKIDFTGR